MRLRLPRLAETTEELIAMVAGKSALAEETKSRYMYGPGRYGEWLMWAHATDLFDVTWRFGAELYGLVAGQRAGGSLEDNLDLINSDGQKSQKNFERFVLMMVWMQMEMLHNQYTRTVVIDILTEGTSLTRDKLLFIDQPEAELWSDDERLVLLFSEAAFNYKMTDELFEAALEAWGAEHILNSLFLCSYYWGLNLMVTTIGCDRYVGLRGDKPLAEQTGWPGRDPSVQPL